MNPYKHKGEVKKKLTVFEEVLKGKGYAVDTIRQMRNYAGVYLQWLEGKGLEVEEVDYTVFTDFVLELKERKSQSMTRRILQAVRHYYRSIDADHNPAAGMYIRGARASVLNDILPYKELLKVYEEYEALDDRGKRNKVMLGLYIYQGITRGSLQLIEPGHVQLKAGKIYVPGYGQMNSRVLDLEAVQLLDLQEYLTIIRPRMLTNIGNYRPGRKPKETEQIINDRLFFSENGSASINSSIYHLFRALKKRYPKIRSGKVIRSTVLAEWLKTRDVRIVQYMAGHKWVSSTERYDVGRLGELKEQMKKYHPLGNKVNS